MTNDNTVLYTCDYLIRWCGFTPSRKKSKKDNCSINDKFSQVIDWLYQNYYISDFEADEFGGNNFQYCAVDKDRFFSSGNFAIIYDFEFQILKSYESKYKPLTNSVILLVLTYIRLNMWRRIYQYTGESETTKKEKPEICNKQYTEISSDLGVSSRLISRSIDALENFGIIAVKHMPRFKDETGQWHTEDTIFVNSYRYLYDTKTRKHRLDCDYDYEKEIRYGIKFLQERKYSSKKFYQD